MYQLLWVRFVCGFFPPILAQTIRDRLISIRKAEKMAMSFKRKSFTGSYLWGNTDDFHAFKFLIHGYFDWRNIILAKKILHCKNGDFIEVGANIGTETVSLTDINPNNVVHAFEPLPSNFESLKRIKNKNNLENLKLYDVLVSETKGEAYFKVPSKNSSGSGHIIREVHSESQRFDVVTLDDTLSHSKMVAAIIADVEGFEPQVLAGAKKLIKNHNPFLILEVNKRFLEERGQTTLPQFYDKLHTMGYHCFYIERMGLREVNAQNFEAKTNKNWLCIPNDFIDKKGVFSKAIRNNSLNPFLRYFII